REPGAASLGYGAHALTDLGALLGGPFLGLLQPDLGKVLEREPVRLARVPVSELPGRAGRGHPKAQAGAVPHCDHSRLPRLGKRRQVFVGKGVVQLLHLGSIVRAQLSKPSYAFSYTQTPKHGEVW